MKVTLICLLVVAVCVSGRISHSAKKLSQDMEMTAQQKVDMEILQQYQAYTKHMAKKQQEEGWFREKITPDCKTFTCNNGNEPRQNDAGQVMNGCGASSPGFSSWLSRKASSMAPEEFTSCCNTHDRCYGQCGASKAQCDQDMETCMKNKMQNVRDRLGWRGRLFAPVPSAMGQAVMSFGCDAFEKAQEKHCSCEKAEDKAEDKAEEKSSYKFGDGLVSGIIKRGAERMKEGADALVDGFSSTRSQQQAIEDDQTNAWAGEELAQGAGVSPDEVEVAPTAADATLPYGENDQGEEGLEVPPPTREGDDLPEQIEEGLIDEGHDLSEDTAVIDDNTNAFAGDHHVEEGVEPEEVEVAPTPADATLPGSLASSEAGSTQGPPPSDGSTQGPPPSDGSTQGPPPSDGSTQGPPPSDGSTQGPPPPQEQPAGSASGSGSGSY